MTNTPCSPFRRSFGELSCRDAAPPLASLATLLHDGRFINSKRVRYQRRLINEHEMRRNAWVLGPTHLPWPDTCPTCMYVGEWKREYEQLLPGSNWANWATLPLRRASHDRSAAFWRTSAATSEGEALDSRQRRYQQPDFSGLPVPADIRKTRRDCVIWQRGVNVGSQVDVRGVRIMRADATLRLTSGVRWTPKRRRLGSALARARLFRAP